MAAMNESLKRTLSRRQEIDIAVPGAAAGQAKAFPVWFVIEEAQLYLLPAHGSDTRWYQKVLKRPVLRVKAPGAEAEFQASAITDAKQISAIVEKFRAKYGDGGVKLYTKLDVAILCKPQG